MIKSFVKIAFDQEFDHEEFELWKKKAKIALASDLLEAIKNEQSYLDWSDKIFDGEMSDEVLALLDEGDKKFGIDKASNTIREIIQRLQDPKQIQASTMDWDDFSFLSSERQKTLDEAFDFWTNTLGGNPEDFSEELAKEIYNSDQFKYFSQKTAAKKKEPKKPKKVKEIADAIRRDNKDVSDAAAYKMAWESYCSYINPGYDGCTSKGKSKRKSPKSSRKANLKIKQAQNYDQQISIAFSASDWIFIEEALKSFSGWGYLKSNNPSKDELKNHNKVKKDLVSKIDQHLHAVLSTTDQTEQ